MVVELSVAFALDAVLLQLARVDKVLRSPAAAVAGVVPPPPVVVHIEDID